MDSTHSATGANAVVSLVYDGQIIHERGDMLSLTDMWSAARAKHIARGGDATDFEHRRPDDWKKDRANRAFMGHVADNLNALPEGIWVGTRGAGGGTWAHWQIGLAYAKYVSPEFHVWCNTVVRAHMEGRDITKARGDLVVVIRDQSERIERLEAMLTAMVITHDQRRAAFAYASVRVLLEEAKALPKGRNSLNRKIGRALQGRALFATSQGEPAPCLKDANTGTWLWKRDFADRYMREIGNGLVATHNDKVTGQTCIRFPDRRAKPGHEAQPGA